VFGTEAFHGAPAPLNVHGTLAEFDAFTQQVILSSAEPEESPRLPHSTAASGALELRWQLTNPGGITVVAEVSADLGQGEEGWQTIPVAIDALTGESVASLVPAEGEPIPPRRFLRTGIRLIAPQERPNDDWDP
jgi:hypothetical protein